MQHDFARILASTRSIAVLGAHDQRARAAFYVPEHMHRHGYRIFPVNPTLGTKELFGEPVRGSLADVDAAFEMLNVFRRSSHLMDHLPEILALDRLPSFVWLQLGIRHDGFAAALRDAGVEVVQDRCLLVEHRQHALR